MTEEILKGAMRRLRNNGWQKARWSGPDGICLGEAVRRELKERGLPMYGRSHVDVVVALCNYLKVDIASCYHLKVNVPNAYPVSLESHLVGWNDTRATRADIQALIQHYIGPVGATYRASMEIPGLPTTMTTAPAAILMCATDKEHDYKLLL